MFSQKPNSVFFYKFFDNFSETDLEEVKIEKTSTQYRFGGEKPVPTTERVTFPCYILGEKTKLTADVVPRDVPFLMSKGEMKTRGFKIDFDTVFDKCHYSFITKAFLEMMFFVKALI